jgi:O-acetylhomoserine/O-acetylserine sulfhydrylase-like pyridoxal-dependent enzyme
MWSSSTLYPEDFVSAINEKTKDIFVEIISNSDGMLADISAMADLCTEWFKMASLIPSAVGTRAPNLSRC